MKASEAHRHYACVGVPISEQRTPLVPEVADVDGGERVIAMLVCGADDVVPVRLVSGKGLDFESRRRKVCKIVEEVRGTFCAEPMRIETNGCLACGYEVDLSACCSLNEGERALAEQCSVAAAVWPCPLASGRVEVAGDVVPGEAIELLEDFLRIGVLDVMEHSRDFVDGDDAVGRAVVFAERAVREGVVVEPLQTCLSVVGEFVDAEKLSCGQRDIGAHNGDVGVARADVSAFDGICGVDNGLLDFVSEVIGESVLMVAGDLQELGTAEIGPVPVGG